MTSTDSLVPAATSRVVPPRHQLLALALGALLLVLLLTFLSTALAIRWSTAPRGVALGLDLLPLLSSVLGSCVVAWRLWRGAGFGLSWCVSVVGFLSGTVVASLGVAHSTAVASAVDAYGFRTYSLFLLGALLVVSGSAAALTAPRQVLGARSGARDAFFVWTFILLMNVPLIPLQGFAVALSVFAVVNLVLNGVARTRTATEPPAS